MSQEFKGNLKCQRCPVCDGYGCINLIPGLGGVSENYNFQANCAAWDFLYKKAGAGNSASGNTQNKIDSVSVKPSDLRCGPVTGAVENIGFENEGDFYYPYLSQSANAGFGLCVGDGYPDEKLKYGIKAVQEIGKKAAFFLKPYPNQKLAERVEWIKPYAEYIGMDIDSYNILTMRNLVNLERKSLQQISEFRSMFSVPFVIKGVFTEEDIELVKNVHPDVVYISNHGGRVETRHGSTAEFLEQHVKELKKYCSQVWVDGGIRTKKDVQTALYYGADQVIAARPLIRAVFDSHFGQTVESLIK